MYATQFVNLSRSGRVHVEQLGFFLRFALARMLAVLVAPAYCQNRHMFVPFTGVVTLGDLLLFFRAGEAPPVHLSVSQSPACLRRASRCIPSHFYFSHFASY